MLAEANALLNAVAGGEAPGAQTQGVLESIDELTGLGFVCDESGCVLVLPQSSTDEDDNPALNTLLEGRGWRLGRVESPEDLDYPGVVAGSGWSVPLKETELGDVLAVLQQLRYAVAELHSKGQWLPAGGDRPVSRAKWNTRHIAMQATWADGEQPSFSVDITLRPGKRPVYTSWTVEATADLLAALDGTSGPPSGSATARAPRLPGRPRLPGGCIAEKDGGGGG